MCFYDKNGNRRLSVIVMIIKERNDINKSLLEEFGTNNWNYVNFHTNSSSLWYNTDSECRFLGYNSITYISPDAFSGLTALTQLWLQSIGDVKIMSCLVMQGVSIVWVNVAHNAVFSAMTWKPLNGFLYGVTRWNMADES